MKTRLSRISEVALSLGIPAVAYLADGAPLQQEYFFPNVCLILVGAVHVIVVNDHVFSTSASIAFGRFLDSRHRTLKWGFLLFVALSIPFLPVSGALVLLTMLLWDFYSIYGKRDWRLSLMCNFLGGSAHFLIGVACASSNSFAIFADSAARLAPETLFFAFAMTSGAMHHESFDVIEDGEFGYKTGAVLLSADRWWRLAAVPMVFAVVPLAFSTISSFRNYFMVAVSGYLAAYALHSLSPKPSTKPRFRLICRTIFVLAAAIFAYHRIVS